MNTKQKPVCIQREEIAMVAQQGVERALAARKHMVELSAEQTAEIGGGLFLAAESAFSLSLIRSPIIYGGSPIPVLDRYSAGF